MLDTKTAATPDPDHAAAVVWVDRYHALVARKRRGQPEITQIARELDLESQYLVRIAHEAADCDRLVIMGPDDARLAFEREYVALYRRPDRLIDVGTEMAPRFSDLVDRLRFLDPTVADR